MGVLEMGEAVEAYPESEGRDHGHDVGAGDGRRGVGGESVVEVALEGARRRAVVDTEAARRGEDEALPKLVGDGEGSAVGETRFGRLFSWTMSLWS